MSRLETRVSKLESKRGASEDIPKVLVFCFGDGRGSVLGYRVSSPSGEYLMRLPGESEAACQERAIAQLRSAQEAEGRPRPLVLFLVAIRDKVWCSRGKIYGMARDEKSGKWSFVVYGPDEETVIFRSGLASYASLDTVEKAAVAWMDVNLPPAS